MSTQEERETTAPVTIDLPLWLIERITQISGKSGVDTSTVVRNALLQEIFPLGKSMAAAAIIALFGLVCAPAWSEELEVKGENTAVEAPKKVKYELPPAASTTPTPGVLIPVDLPSASPTPASVVTTAPATTPAVKPVKKRIRNCEKRG